MSDAQNPTTVVDTKPARDPLAEAARELLAGARDMSEREPCDDAEVMCIWRECGLPEYFLGNGGTNHKLVEFARRLRQLTEEQEYDRERDRYDAMLDRRMGWDR